MNVLSFREIDLFHLAALNNGAQIASRGIICLSTVMHEPLIDEIGDRLSSAMADVAAELD